MNLKNFTLKYGPICVGEITDAFVSGDTWFGCFQCRQEMKPTTNQARIFGFIEFCIEWHRRLKNGDSVDPSDFDQFEDVLESGQWTIESADCVVFQICEAPVFVEAEISWRLTS